MEGRRCLVLLFLGGGAGLLVDADQMERDAAAPEPLAHGLGKVAEHTRDPIRSHHQRRRLHRSVRANWDPERCDIWGDRVETYRENGLRHMGKTGRENSFSRENLPMIS